MSLRTQYSVVEARCECCDGNTLTARCDGDSSTALTAELVEAGWVILRGNMLNGGSRVTMRHVCRPCADEITKAVLARLPKAEGSVEKKP